MSEIKRTIMVFFVRTKYFLLGLEELEFWRLELHIINDYHENIKNRKFNDFTLIQICCDNWLGDMWKFWFVVMGFGIMVSVYCGDYWKHKKRNREEAKGFGERMRYVGR